MSAKIAHLVFDVESVADGALIAKVVFGQPDMPPAEAINAYQQQRLQRSGSTFIPYTFQKPIAVVVGTVSSDFELLDIVSLDEPEFRPHVIAKQFWAGWKNNHMPQWVTFNGRSFDIPLMELCAYRYGINIKDWFDESGYKSRRNRYSTHAHLDLQELLTNYGASRFNGGLNCAAQTLGKPGKMGLSGDQVQTEYDAGRVQQIADYCRCDVLDTYFVFLRCLVMIGKTTLEQEAELTRKAKAWLEARCEENQACADYLDGWGDWENPWVA